ncbi:MAG: hypothetical protein U0359_10880 [Byssovorax sp.]
MLRRSKGNPHFARSELLFDILACEYELVGGPVHTGSQIPRVVRPLVQVESELAQNTRDSVTDFNKLVCGSAAWSLFVGPLNASNGSISYLDMLAPLADRVTGRVCIAFIPHPEEWPSTAGALGFAWDRGPRGWRVVG